MTDPRHRNRYKVVAQAVVAHARLNGTPCCYCGLPIRPDDEVDCDHAIPVSEAPHLALAPSNLRAAHRSCNRSVGASYGNRQRAKNRRTSRYLGRPQVPAEPGPPCFITGDEVFRTSRRWFGEAGECLKQSGELCPESCPARPEVDRLDSLERRY